MSEDLTSRMVGAFRQRWRALPDGLMAPEQARQVLGHVFAVLSSEMQREPAPYEDVSSEILLAVHQHTLLLKGALMDIAGLQAKVTEVADKVAVLVNLIADETAQINQVITALNSQNDANLQPIIDQLTSVSGILTNAIRAVPQIIPDAPPSP